MKPLAAALQAMSQDSINEFEKNGTFTLNVEGQEAVVNRDDVEIISEDIPGWLVANEGRLTVALDIMYIGNVKIIYGKNGRTIRPSVLRRSNFIMNKEHWNDLYLDQLDDDFIEKCIRDSYSLVVSKLSKKLREKYNGNNL